MRLALVWYYVIGMIAEDEATPRVDAVREIAARDFIALVEPRLDHAYRLAGLILGNATEAEDAAQDALMRAWVAAPSLRDPAAIGAWLDRIVVNVCRDRLRRRSHVRELRLDGVEVPIAADPFRAMFERDAVLGPVRRLDVDERIVVVLHYWGDLTLDAVAVRLGVRKGTVRSRLHRALEKIRADLAAQHQGTDQ